MQQCPVESPLLDGHLSLTVELLAFRSVTERYHIGSHPKGQQLIQVCHYLSSEQEGWGVTKYFLVSNSGMTWV